jgi:hypothetical protein
MEQRRQHETASDVKRAAYLFQRHPVLNQERDARVQVPHILFEDKVLLGLRRDLRLEFSQDLLGFREIVVYDEIGLIR